MVRDLFEKLKEILDEKYKIENGAHLMWLVKNRGEALLEWEK